MKNEKQDINEIIINNLKDLLEAERNCIKKYRVSIPHIDMHEDNLDEKAVHHNVYEDFIHIDYIVDKK